MKTAQITKTEIDRFHKLILQGIEAWTKAGKLLVKMVDKDPDVYDEIVERHPGVTKSVLAQLEAVGRETLEPRLLLNGCAAFQKLKKAPLSEQRKALEGGIKVYEPDPKGRATHRVVRPQEMSPFQVSQVFAPGGVVRSPLEQQAYLAKREGRKAAVSVARETDDREGYTIKGSRVVFHGSHAFTAAELAKILGEITK